MNLHETGSVFRYRALTIAGEEHRGELAATSDVDARLQLTSRGLLLLELQASRQIWAATPRIGSRDLALGLRMLANLVECGIPMTEALTTFKDVAPPTWAAALPHIVHSVNDGKALSHAMATSPLLSLPSIVLCLVRAGEAGAGLGTGLREAADWAERRSADRAALRNALAYPAIVASAGLAAIVVMVGIVLPKFARMLAELDQATPPLTTVVIRTAEIGRVAFIPSLFAVIVGFLLLKARFKGADGELRLRELVLQLPIVGGLRFAALSSHLLASLAALLRNGVTMSAALPLAAEATGDVAIKSRVRAAVEMLIAGKSLAHALGKVSVVSAASLRLIAVGEASGELVNMLAHAASMERSRAAAITQRFLRVLEPTLLLVVSGIVAVIAVAMLQAVYSVRPAT